MNKFHKRIIKTIGHAENAVIFGRAAMLMDVVLEVFKNVFVYDIEPTPYRSKNLVFRKNFTAVEISEPISACFIDRKYLKEISFLSAVLIRYKPIVFIEGKERLSPPDSDPLYDLGYLYNGEMMDFHYWMSKNK